MPSHSQGFAFVMAELGRNFARAVDPDDFLAAYTTLAHHPVVLH